MNDYNPNCVILRIRKSPRSYGRILSNALRAYEVTAGHRPSRRIPDGNLIINWGMSATPVWESDVLSRGCHYLNKPSTIKWAVNKLHALERLRQAGLPVVQFTTDREEAESWIEQGIQHPKPIVYARTTLTGSKGQGIHLGYARPLPQAPLYTKAFPTTHEFRVHAVAAQRPGFECIDYVQKKKRNKVDANFEIRNHKNGWVFCHKDIVRSDRLIRAAHQAVTALGLDFGAVDILAICAGRYGPIQDFVICEVNTCPGLKCTETKQRYIDYFKKLAHENGPDTSWNSP